MNQKSGAARHLSAHSFTEKQGQYLAFIYTYSHMFRRPPAETDMQRHFQVSPPSVHQMVVTLDRNGFIRWPTVHPFSFRNTEMTLRRNPKAQLRSRLEAARPRI